MTGYLLDTHTLLWFDTQFDLIPKATRDVLQESDAPVYVSAVVYWELSIKHRLGKLPEAKPLLNDYEATLLHYRFRELAFTIQHAIADSALKGDHKDPFDRGLAAQALTDKLTVITKDPAIRSLGARTRW